MPLPSAGDVLPVWTVTVDFESLANKPPAVTAVAIRIIKNFFDIMYLIADFTSVA
jgi:hypothetical protein